MLLEPMTVPSDKVPSVLESIWLSYTTTSCWRSASQVQIFDPEF